MFAKPTLLSLGLVLTALLFLNQSAAAETADQHDKRMAWWREARFGMFIHWGLYSVAAGQWKGQPIPGYSSWSLHTLKIPLEEYTPLKDRFNPVRFDADQWASLAKAAGMKYIIITSRHHEGFSLFDSKHTDFDVMATPFRRDIMKELCQACRRQGIRIGWYYSILDWHHPDYLPRRPGDERPTEDADYDRFVAFMKGQLRELVTNYGPIDVLWFDGEWEKTWTHERGKDLYDYVRGLQPDIIINNRVGKGRQGMQGLNSPGDHPGDFGTPEQEIPPAGLPGVDWESCMTMNDTWGYKENDHNWKSATTLLRMLVDCAGKGGNFLLNVGPTPDGTIPQPSVERLATIGRWLQRYGQSIYGTRAGPFSKPLPWGRCTARSLPDGKTRLYLHVFDWPQDGKLVVPPLGAGVSAAYLLADAKSPLAISRAGSGLQIAVPQAAPDESVSVVVLEVDKPEPPWKSPLVYKGKLNTPLVEVTPFVFKDRLYLLENWQKLWEMPNPASGHRYQEDRVRIRDVEADKIVSVALVGHGLGMALVWENRVYVFAGDWGNSKKKQIPEALYGVNKYVGGPALYYEGNTYYTLYLQSLGGGRYETRITRSKDLVSWEDAPEDRPFVTFNPENLVHPVRSDTIHECNASDAEVVFWQGKTLVYFTGGDQHVAGDLQWAEFDGTPRALFERHFEPPRPKGK